MAVLPHECLFSFSLPATAKNFAFSYKEIWQLNLFRCCFRDTTFCTESQFFFFFFWSTAVLLIQLHRQKPKFCPSIWDGMSHYFHLKVFLCSESFLFFLWNASKTVASYSSWQWNEKKVVSALLEQHGWPCLGKKRNNISQTPRSENCQVLWGRPMIAACFTGPVHPATTGFFRNCAKKKPKCCNK